ncbi:MAG TPA: hypothetical protein VFP44_17135 [Usitatibacter sp.]|nr:hypothetical protein [Usitatibacter sp.]
MRISKDKLSATVELQGDYCADEIEELIRQLSALRAQMLPAVPMAPGDGNRDPVAGRAGGDPRVQVAVMRGGVTRFWVRHEGLGWFGFNLPVERSRTLAQYILGLSTPREQARQFHGLKRRASDLSH